MPVMNSGTQLGPSSRWPSPEVAACTGAPVIRMTRAAATNALRTATRLTTRSRGELPDVAQCHVPQRVVHRLQREVRLRHAEPEPVLVSIRAIRPLPEPHEARLQPRPLLPRALECAHRIARLQRRGHPPELLDRKR